MKGRKMRAEKTILLLVVILVVLAILLMTSIGYAVENGEELKISNNKLLLKENSDLRIEFLENPTYTGNGVALLKLTGPTTAVIDITGLKSVGDSVTVKFTIANKSEYTCADIKEEVTITNTEYFSISSNLKDSNIKPKTGKTTLEITIKLIKLPIKNDVRTEIYANISATPEK